MKRIKSFLKRLSIGIAVVFLTVLVSGIIFINVSPEFGGKILESKEKEYSKSVNYSEGKFKLTVPISTSEDRWKSIWKFFKSKLNKKPLSPINPVPVDSLELVNYEQKATKLIWFGHSTFLIQMQGLNILLDPMFGEYPAPLPIPSLKRFSEDLPISVGELPYIDLVVFSHDHYDHLDYKSVVQLKDKVGAYYVPLGVGAHLNSWGVNKDRITEMDWWDESIHGNLKLVCTPAQHFSGRGLFDQAKTLWASWVIKSDKETIYFSGDGGYGKHFKEIGNKYGPFDISLMECGQYDKDWANIHMFPEQTVQATHDLRSNLMMPIHWGGFKLANHSWIDPIERVVAEAKKIEVNIITPQIGEAIYLNERFTNNFWWRKYK